MHCLGPQPQWGCASCDTQANVLFQHLLSLLHPGSFSFPLLPSRHGLNSTFSGVLWNENDHCIEVQCLGHMRLCHNSQGLWITQAEPCYLCTLERHVHTEIPTIRKGNMWVHLRSPRWAMLSWYFTWKDRIGDCLWTWVNICVCCQNKKRRAHKQNKGYMGAVPRGLNKERGRCARAVVHTHRHTHPYCTSPSSLREHNGRRESSLATFTKICGRWGTKSEFWHLLACCEILPQRDGGRFDPWMREGWGSVVWFVSTPISAWPLCIRFVWERSVWSSQS